VGNCRKVVSLVLYEWVVILVDGNCRLALLLVGINGGHNDLRGGNDLRGHIDSRGDNNPREVDNIHKL